MADFITKTDLLAYIDEVELDNMIENDDDKLIRPIKDALSRIRGKLNHRYDTTAIFAAPANELFATVKKIGVDITLYFLYTSVQTRHIPEHRKDTYEKAEFDLNDLAENAWENDLPKKTPDDPDGTGENVNPGAGYATYEDFKDTDY